MKTLKHAVNWVIWSMVALYAALMTLTHIPLFQQWMGERVAHVISQKLGTEVRVGRIDLGFLNRVIVDDLELKDQANSELLRVGRLSVRVDYLSLAEGRIVISSAQLFNAHATLYRKDSLSSPNFQFIVDSLASKDNDSDTPLQLAINSLIVRRSSVSYDDYSQADDTGVLNPNHLKFTDISAHVLLKELTDNTLFLNVKRISLKEKSGLSLRRLSFTLERNGQQASLSNFFVQLPRSSMTIERMDATADPSHIAETLSYQGALTDVSITPSDLAFLTPSVTFHKSPVSLTATFKGTGNSIDIDHLRMVSSDGGLSVNASGWIRQWDTQPTWHADVEQAAIAHELLDSVRHHVPALPELLTRTGNLLISGQATQHGNGTIDLQADAIMSEAGKIQANGQITRDKHFEGSLVAQELRLSTLLDKEELGLLSATVNVKGSPNDIGTQGKISQFDFKGYSYSNIDVDGAYRNGDVAGKLSVNDPNVEAYLEGTLERKEALSLKVAGNVRHISPMALHLSNQWEHAVFGADIRADFRASDLNDAVGTCEIDNFYMRDTTYNYQVSHLHAQSGYDNGKHFLRVRGDMGHAELIGAFDWATLPQSLFNYIATKLPTLPGLPATNKRTDNDFEMMVSLNDAAWARHLLNIDLSLDHPFNLQARVSDQRHEIEIEGTAPSFTYNGSAYRNGRIRISSPSDTMRCEVDASRHSEDGRRLDLALHATASHNTLATSLRWDNGEKENTMKGLLNCRTNFYRNMEGLPEAHINILPSHAAMGDAEWSIEPGGVIYNARQLIVDHVACTHQAQHIIVDGIASDKPTDSLYIDLSDVEVAYFLDLVNFTAVSFAGQATGRAYVVQAFGNPEAWADLQVSHFLFEGGRMGTLTAQGRWNQEEKQIDIHAIADDGKDAMTFIDGFVSPVKDNIDLSIKGRGTYIDFLHTYSSSFLSQVTGQATGDLRLVGPLGEMDLQGTLVVDGQATVSALGTTYTLEKETVRLVHDDILLNDVVMHDRYNNTARLNGGIHHENLSNLTFDLSVKTDHLLAYDIAGHEENPAEEIFYGTVFAMGDVDMRGRPGEVIINCNATPQPGTVFTYNAANPEAIYDQSFITWQDGGKKNADSLADGMGEDESGTTSIPTDLHINFLVNTTPEATLRILMDAKTKDYITLGGSGVIRASYYNKGAFQMFGTYNVEQGQYGITIQNIIKKNFTFQPGGTIVFGGSPFDAALNMQAIYTVNGVSLSDLNIGNSFTNNTVRVNCLMNIKGQAGAPQVDFDLDMPTVNSEEKQMIRSVITSEQEMNQQVLYLLGIGRFYTQGINDANSQRQYDQTQLAMQSFLSGTLSTQINEVLSQVLKSGNWNFGANISTGNEGWHNAEYEGLVSGRMLNNRLLVNGQFGYRDNTTQATPSFIGDFDIRYLLYPNGNLAMKMYNQTNDRYFTHSSLNTQGIGLIMKKDFDGLGDLFHHRKRRKSNE